MTAVLYPHPDVLRVELVGSRARGEANALSDWDFRIDTANAPMLVHELPALVTPLDPLAAQWDRFADRAVYMLVLSGAVKIDLFAGNERHEIEPPWEPTRGNLAAIDAHFWDWVLWLGGKSLGGRHDVVAAELDKLHRYLLAPLGVVSRPPTIDAAFSEYRAARDRLERQWMISVPRQLGDDVAAALTRQGVV